VNLNISCVKIIVILYIGHAFLGQSSKFEKPVSRLCSP